MGTFSLFFDKFKVQIVVVLLIIMAGMVVYHKTTMGLLQKELEDAQKRNGELVVENSALHTANKQAKADIDIQNAKIMQMKIDTAEASQKAADALADVVKQRDAWKSRYDRILTAPPPSKDDCQNTAVLLEQYRETRVTETTGGTP